MEDLSSHLKEVIVRRRDAGAETRDLERLAKLLALDEIYDLHLMHLASENPLCSLHGLLVCAEYGLPLPVWIRQYLLTCLPMALTVEPGKAAAPQFAKAMRILTKGGQGTTHSEFLKLGERYAAAIRIHRESSADFKKPKKGRAKSRVQELSGKSLSWAEKSYLEFKELLEAPLSDEDWNHRKRVFDEHELSKLMGMAWWIPGLEPIRNDRAQEMVDNLVQQQSERRIRDQEQPDGLNRFDERVLDEMLEPVLIPTRFLLRVVGVQDDPTRKYLHVQQIRTLLPVAT